MGACGAAGISETGSQGTGSQRWTGGQRRQCRCLGCRARGWRAGADAQQGGEHSAADAAREMGMEEVQAT